MNKKIKDLVESINESCSDLMCKSRTKCKAIENIDYMIEDTKELLSALKINKEILERDCLSCSIEK